MRLFRTLAELSPHFHFRCLNSRSLSNWLVVIDKPQFATSGEQPNTPEADSLFDEESVVRLREFFAIIELWDR